MSNVFIIRKCKLKLPWDTTTQLLKWLKIFLMVAPETLLNTWWECKLQRPLWKTVWQFLQLNIYLLYNPSILLLGINRNENLGTGKKKYAYENSQQLYSDASNLETIQMSINQQIENQPMAHSYNKILYSSKSGQNYWLTNDGWMTLKCILLSAKAKLEILHVIMTPFIWYSGNRITLRKQN